MNNLFNNNLLLLSNNLFIVLCVRQFDCKIDSPANFVLKTSLCGELGQVHMTDGPYLVFNFILNTITVGIICDGNLAEVTMMGSFVMRIHNKNLDFVDGSQVFPFFSPFFSNSYLVRDGSYFSDLFHSQFFFF